MIFPVALLQNALSCPLIPEEERHLSLQLRKQNLLSSFPRSIFFLKLHIEYIKLLTIIHLSKNFGSV